jgi:hypothetical protein
MFACLEILCIGTLCVENVFNFDNVKYNLFVVAMLDCVVTRANVLLELAYFCFKLRPTTTR